MDYSNILYIFASVKQRRLRPPNENDLSAIGMKCVAAFISVVELFTNMIESLIPCFVFGTLAGWFYARSRHYKKKYNNLQGKYNIQRDLLKNAHGGIGRLQLDNESIREANKSLAEQIHEYKHLMTSGCRNMKVLERTLPMLSNIPQGVVVIAGVDTRRSDLYFPIKTFMYDINDPEDRKFAIRQAEELIETIQKF